MNAVEQWIRDTVAAGWPLLVDHPAPFIAVFAFGISIGWALAWLHFRQQLNVRADRIEHYRSLVGDSKPSAEVVEQRSTLSVIGPRRIPASSEFDRWRMTVHNSGPAAATNVQMKLRNIRPRPRAPEWHAEYPYPVVRAGQTPDALPPEINRDDSDDFDAVPVTRSRTGQLTVHLNTKAAGTSGIQVESGEKWEIEYEVTAKNANPVKFSLWLYVEDGAVKVSRG
jgi:hypothetical protein